MSKPKIGFIGLGIMGKPMAGHLIDAGYELVVHNRNRDAVDELVGKGATEAHSGKEVAEQSDIVITMLPDSPDVESVALDEGGILEGAHEGLIFVDMSTIAPSVTTQVGEVLAQKGVQSLDAPVSGGDIGAQNATLSIMVGGDEDTFNTVKPLFDIMGQSAILCGPLGAGQTVKACNQILVAVTIAGVSEALTMGTKAGVDPIKIVQVLSGDLRAAVYLKTGVSAWSTAILVPGFAFACTTKTSISSRKRAMISACPCPLPVRFLSFLRPQ